MKSTKNRTLAFALAAMTSMISASGYAATGTITVKPAFSGVFTKTSNISGPSVAHSNATASFTATFGNLTNTSGSITADLSSQAKGEYLCTSTFQTVVYKGSCSVTFANQGGGQLPACSYSVVSTDPTTCNFSVIFTDNQS